MDTKIKFLLTCKLFEQCDLPKENAVYVFLLDNNNDTSLFPRTYTNSLSNLPRFLEGARELYCNKKSSLARDSYELRKMTEQREEIINIISENRGLLGLNEMKMSDDITSISLAMLAGIYLKSFIRPVQFFLPHSSSCSGQWSFWEDNNYFELIERINNKQTILKSFDSLSKSDLWNIKFEPEDFPEIVKRRLEKDDAFNKKLDPNALMKAMIIRMGEIARPNINYEIIDYTIRSFFTDLNVKNYLRVDREIRFLRMFEKEIMSLL